LAQYYNLTVSYVLQNTACNNISSYLTTCAPYVDVSQTYDVSNVANTVANAVANTETFTVPTILTSLQAGWGYCNTTILQSYACQAAFQPYMCQSNGQLTTNYLCSTQCDNTLSTKCKQGAAPNICESNACTSASKSINSCNSPPPPPPRPNSGARLSSFVFGSILIYLLFFYLS